MTIHDEETDDGTYTCRHCPYQNNNEDQLKQHINRTHINRNEAVFYCDQCSKPFKTESELTNHVKDNHKSYKPCKLNKESRCDLDTECMFNHEKLKPGDEICYKCGKVFTSKKELGNHIVDKHGQTMCHKFLKNECT